jgi:hypothetical protein
MSLTQEGKGGQSRPELGRQGIVIEEMSIFNLSVCRNKENPRQGDTWFKRVRKLPYNSLVNGYRWLH